MQNLSVFQSEILNLHATKALIFLNKSYKTFEPDRDDSYRQSTTTVLTATASSLAGLSADEAHQRLSRFGPNALPQPAPPSKLKRLIRQFHNVLIYVLLAATLITFVLQHYVDASVILAVVLINALIGYLQEGKAESALAGLQQLMAPTAVVIRDGQRQTLPAENLVIGDIVLLEAGERVPADLLLPSAN